MLPGDTRFGWRPEGWWEVEYFLRPIDADAYGDFLEKTAAPVAWQGMSSYAPIGDEPTNAALREALVEWWARPGDDLWLLVERMWSGWPDPLMYSLFVRRPGEPRFTECGEFDDLPPGWTFPAGHPPIARS